MPGWVSPWELLLLLAFALLLFGPKRLPEMGRSLGKGMREFKDSLTGKDEDDKREELGVAATPAVPPTPAPPPAASPPAPTPEHDPRV